jgi:hypothetical protein
VDVRGALATMARWSLGVLLVTWRYLWATTPLHRSVTAGDDSDVPPALPPHLLDARSQTIAAGVGPLTHRRFGVDIAGARRRADELIQLIAADLNRGVPSEVASVEPISPLSGRLRVGEELVVRMPGPWDGPVRVVHRDSTSFRFATLAGHMEAGQIKFRAQPSGDWLRFEIEPWARPGNRLVHLLSTYLWLGSEIQLNMWIRFCLAAAELAGGRPVNGVTVQTRMIEQPRLLYRFAQAERGSTAGR